MNEFRVLASIAEKSVLRFTPSGIPIASAVLVHSSKQDHVEAQRQIELEIHAIAAGEISKRFLDIKLGVCMMFIGFLARKNRNSKSLVFHVTSFEDLKCEINLLD